MLFRENKVLGTPLSAISFGGASLSGEGGGYGFGAISESEAEKLILSAWDHGINLFDTAPIYGFGLSEERMGRYLPKEAIVVNKGGVDWHPNKRVNMSNDPKIIEKMFYESLRRLNRDYIDIYMIHWPDFKIDIRLPLEVLIKAKEKGHIKSIGLCNTNLNDLAIAQEMISVDFLQSELNVFNTQSFESLELEWKKRFSMSWGTFDKGILTGRVTEERKFPSEDCRSWAPWWNKKTILLKILKTKKLKMILDEENISLVSFCLSFNLHYIGVSTCLVGFKNQFDLGEITLALQSLPSKTKIEEVLKRWE